MATPRRMAPNVPNVLAVVMGGGQGTRLYPLTKDRSPAEKPVLEQSPPTPAASPCEKFHKRRLPLGHLRRLFP